MTRPKNLYNLLKVPKDATGDEIRKAYFEAARRLHPDANPDPKAAELFIQIQEAYETLVDSTRRQRYDESIGATGPLDPSVSMNLIYSRAVLPVLKEPQLVYVLLELISTAEQGLADTQALNLCLLIDRSTSMQGARMDMVKANAVQMMRQMKKNDVLSIVTFSDRAEVLLPATMGPDVARLEAKISMIMTGGGTEILQGLEAGVAEVRRHLNQGCINHIILLTDGNTYGDEPACVEIANACAAQGIGISGLGIGHEWNDDFLDKLATISGGSSMYISAPKDLHKHMDSKFSHLTRIYAENVALELELEPNVELTYAFRIMPESGQLDRQPPIRMGNLVYTKTLTVLLELLVKSIPDSAKPLTLGSGRVKMDIPSRTITTARLPVQFSRPVGGGRLHEPPHPAILQAMSRLTFYRMQERARQEVTAKNFTEATRHLQYLATHLLAEGERDLAHTVLVEAEHIQQTNQFSKEGDKRIKYGTRALLLPPGSEFKKV
jgi:Ca-activated chloride channel family protein